MPSRTVIDVNCMRPSRGELHEEIVALLPRLRRFARTLARNPHDADDLVQIAIERALARSDQLRPDAQVANWMFGILRNAGIDEARASGRRQRIFAPPEAGENVAERTEDTRGEILSVQESMARLPEEQRTAVSLVLIEGFSYKEAAEIMNVPIGTLTSRLARGRESLQAMLSDMAGAV